MKKMLAATLAVCLFCSLCLCGCKKNKNDTSSIYDNAPESAFAYEIVGDEAIITKFDAENTVANIPSKLGDKPVTTIKDEAFEFNGTLDTVNMPATITTIGRKAFAGCTNLRTVSFSIELQEIGEEAFYGCSSLNTINLPPTLTTIRARAFSGCTALKDIAFPEVAVCIGADAFLKTPWMSNETGEYISVCGSLLSYNGTDEEPFIKGDFTTISSAFYNNKTITGVILPKSVKYITSYAFKDCDALEKIDLGENLKTVEIGAFSGCSKLKEVTFPKTITTIEVSDEGSAFDTNTLEKVYGYKETAAETFAKENGIEFIEIKDE